MEKTMAADKSAKQIKDIDLDLKRIPIDQRSFVKDIIGDLLVNAIIDSARNQSSAVEGVGRFKPLKKKSTNGKPNPYRKFKQAQVGNQNADLNLFGDLMNSLSFKRSTAGVSVGVMQSTGNKSLSKLRDQANGHNVIDGRAGPKGLPRRQFIPDGGDSFTSSIMSDVRGLLNSFRVNEILSNASPSEILKAGTKKPKPAKTTSIDIDLDVLFDIEIEKILGS